MKGAEHILLTEVCYVLAGKAPVPLGDEAVCVLAYLTLQVSQV